MSLLNSLFWPEREKKSVSDAKWKEGKGCELTFLESSTEETKPLE